MEAKKQRDHLLKRGHLLKMVYTIKSDIDKDTPMKTQETAEMNV